jgi:two-component system cell cycle sensor histidine kinase/response regulator CckA
VREKTREELVAENAVLLRRLAESEQDVRDDRIVRVLLDGAPDQIALVNAEGRPLPFAAGQSTGLLDDLPAAAQETVRACLARVIASGEPDEYEVEARLPDGRRIPMWTRVSPLRDGARLIGLCAISRDVSRAKATERALRESEETVRLAVTATGMGLWSWQERTGVAVDEAWRRIHGLDGDDQPRTLEQVLQMVHEEDRASIEAGMHALVVKGREVSGEFRVVRPDRSVRWLLSRGVALRDEDGRVNKVVGAALDITERREVEERLRQTQMMEAFGALTAGLAHNFNNLLMRVLPNLDAAVQSASPALLPRLAEAREATLRVVRLVRDLALVAGRRPAGERRDEDLVALSQEAASLCRGLFPPGIALTVSTRGHIAPLALDAPQILQALINPLLNAKDAVEGLTDRPPTVTVTLEHVAAGDLQFPPHVRRVDHVRVEITDNGRGMTEEVRRRAFEPFFTTKDVGKGTGLGLAATYAIVKNHGGWITLSTVPGKGTTFSMMLPALTCGRPAETAVLDTSPPVGRRILIVDDEAAVRAIVGRILVDAGYDVVYAADGSEALAAYERKGPFSAVLLDESMPGIPGRLVLERLLERDPTAKVVMFTGYGPEAESITGAVGVLEKPVAIDALLGFLRRVLERPTAVE